MNASNRAILVTLRHMGGREIRRLSIERFIRAVRLPTCPETDAVELFGIILNVLREAGLVDFRDDERRGFVTDLHLLHRGREEAQHW